MSVLIISFALLPSAHGRAQGAAAGKANATTITNAASTAGLEVLSPDKIGIEILGTIVAKNPKDGVVLLKFQKEGKVNAVRSNYVIKTKDSDQYLVKAVFDEHVVLFKKGQRYILPKDRFAGGVRSSKFQDYAPSTVGGKKIAELDKYSEPGFERKAADAGKVDIRLTSTYKDKNIMGNLSAILMQASAVPFNENGKMIGFQMLQIDEDSIFAKAGIRDDDVVTQINGHPLTDAAGAIKVLQSMKGESAIEFEVYSGGSYTTTRISVE